MLAEIGAGLARPQKELPSKLFYDERGSELFEDITRQPEYYLTGAELALLREHIPRWIAEQRPRALVELGAGSASKTRVILDALCAHGGGTYVPVDISADFLARTAAELRRDYPGLEVLPVAEDFTHSVYLPASLPRPALLTFLGSTIGNFTEAAAVKLLRQVQTAMQPGDCFLLGVDLRKNRAVLEAAYNDRRGVTAAFNLNLLRVVNRRVGADFDPAAFRHRAFYEARRHRIEMHLVSTRPQVVRVPGAGEFAFRDGETIRTEISCKYDKQSIEAILAAADLDLMEWQAGADERFGLALIARPFTHDDGATRQSSPLSSSVTM
ncbi:MAG TPA: L-histidine N(alpha)-methyltransferase [Longimicrobiaceae bacterium]|nr:L-histidine N(alpha)-methyltransferase [Longimicrobiaceae bacterium]